MARRAVQKQPVSSLTPETLSEYVELRSIWRRDPVLYARQRLGMNPTWQQEKILQAIAPPGSKVTVASGHGIGKSAAVSGAIWWHLECTDYAKVPCTAPTQDQLERVLWAELAKWMRKSNAVSEKLMLPRGLWLSSLFSLAATAISEVGSPKEWFAVARTSRKERPDALQGFHADDIEISADGRGIVRENIEGKLLFVIEEASGVAEEIFEVAEGALSSRGARLLMPGNPVRNSGYFYRSHTKDAAHFTKLKFRCDDSPLVDPNYRKKLVRKFGDGSNIVRVRADGEFPRQDDDTLIAVEHTEAACARRGVLAEGSRRLGVDVAEFGMDRTTLVLRQGRVIGPVEVHAKQETMATVGNVVAFANRHDVDEIYVDCIGLGAGVASRLAELKQEGMIRAEVIRVDVRQKAPPRPADRDAAGLRLRDHLWLEGKHYFHHCEPSFDGCFSGADMSYHEATDMAKDMAAEMSVPRYGQHSTGAIVVEDKDSIKRRNEDRRSPDLAEGLLMTFYDKPVVFEWYIDGATFQSAA